jgi:very-short-patch-repair endonuclease
MLKQLLVERSAAGDSALEVLVHRLLRKSGLPPTRQQFQIVEDGQRIVRADFAWPEVKVAVLAQGYRYHHGKLAFEKDAQQISQLASYGWAVLLPTWKRIKRDAPGFVAEARRTYQAAAKRQQRSA